MLAKSSKLNHPLGITFETPLFHFFKKKKGFAFKKKKNNTDADVSEAWMP